MDILRSWIGSEVCATRLSDKKEVCGVLAAVDEDGIIVRVTEFAREEFIPKHNLKCVERENGKERDAVVSEGIGMRFKATDKLREALLT